MVTNRPPELYSRITDTLYFIDHDGTEFSYSAALFSDLAIGESLTITFTKNGKEIKREFKRATDGSIIFIN